MPLDLGRPAGGAGDAAGALMFITSYGQVWEIISGMLSSPWTAESFGADVGKARSFNRYLMHATVNAGAVGTIAAVVARRWWPLIGISGGLAYAWWLYQRALTRAVNSESVGWGTGVDLGLKRANWRHGG